jgi:hypothetical protein
MNFKVKPTHIRSIFSMCLDGFILQIEVSIIEKKIIKKLLNKS